MKDSHVENLTVLFLCDCSSLQREDSLNEKTLTDIRERLTPRPPIDQTYQINSQQAYTVDYKERQHIFIWLPSVATLSFEDYGQGTVQAQIWQNIGIKQGIKCYAPSVAPPSTVLIMVRCTDEEIP